jgi:hypothetical protein
LIFGPAGLPLSLFVSRIYFSAASPRLMRTIDGIPVSANTQIAEKIVESLHMMGSIFPAVGFDGCYLSFVTGQVFASVARVRTDYGSFCVRRTGGCQGIKDWLGGREDSIESNRLLRASRWEHHIEGNRSRLVSKQPQCFIDIRCRFCLVSAKSNDSVLLEEFTDFYSLDCHGFICFSRQAPVGGKIDEDCLSISDEFFQPIPRERFPGNPGLLGVF